MSAEQKTILFLVEGEPEHSFLTLRIIKKYQTFFPNTLFDVVSMGPKSQLLSPQTLVTNLLRLRDPNVIIFLIPDYHPISCYNYDHTNLETFRESIYKFLDRINISNPIIR